MTALCYIGKILEFFSELRNPKSTSGETIQNSLNDWNRKQGLLICNFLFKWNLRNICIFIFKTWKLYFKNNEKVPGNLLKKPGKIMEFCPSGKVGTLVMYSVMSVCSPGRGGYVWTDACYGEEVDIRLKGFLVQKFILTLIVIFFLNSSIKFGAR